MAQSVVLSDASATFVATSGNLTPVIATVGATLSVNPWSDMLVFGAAVVVAVLVVAGAATTTVGAGCSCFLW